MMKIRHRPTFRSCGFSRPAFTLLELLVVMGILILLVTITIISVGALAKDARLTSGTNQVKAALGSARALAMQSGKPAGVAFRVVFPDTGARPYVQAEIVEWSGAAQYEDSDGDSVSDRLANRFLPANGFEPIQLHPAVKIASPWYAAAGNGTDNRDDDWISQPRFPDVTAGNEAPGRTLGVMFDGNGALITGLSNSSSGTGDYGTSGQDYVDWNGNKFRDTGSTSGPSRFELYDEIDDETDVLWCPLLAVFDDDDLRQNFKTSDWAVEANLLNDRKNFINKFANRIHFNRYTGVAMR